MTPGVVQSHPNATLVAATTLCTVLVTWLVTNVFHHPVSAEDGNLWGGGVAVLALASARSCKSGACALGRALGEYGVLGCVERLIHGRKGAGR